MCVCVCGTFASYLVFIDLFWLEEFGKHCSNVCNILLLIYKILYYTFCIFKYLWLKKKMYIFLWMCQIWIWTQCFAACCLHHLHDLWYYLCVDDPHFNKRKKTLVPTISELKVHKGIVLSKQQSNSQLSEICV